MGEDDSCSGDDEETDEEVEDEKDSEAEDNEDDDDDDDDEENEDEECNNDESEEVPDSGIGSPDPTSLAWHRCESNVVAWASDMKDVESLLKRTAKPDGNGSVSFKENELQRTTKAPRHASFEFDDELESELQEARARIKALSQMNAKPGAQVHS